MKKFIYFIWALALVGILLTTGFFVLQKMNVFTPKEVHYHAGFVLFEQNKKIDFSDLKYMSVKPCGGKHEKLTEAELQHEKAHLHDNAGDVVHVHREGALWRDLFTNIKYPLDYAKTTGYINGKKITNWQNQTIRAYDNLVVFVGDNDPQYLKTTVKKEYIQKIEQKSENCGSGSH